MRIRGKLNSPLPTSRRGKLLPPQQAFSWENLTLKTYSVQGKYEVESLFF